MRRAAWLILVAGCQSSGSAPSAGDAGVPTDAASSDGASAEAAPPASDAGPSDAGPSDAGPRKLDWIIAASRLALVQALDAQTAAHFFSGVGTYIIAPPMRPPQLPAGWQSTLTADFQSYAAFETALTNGTIDPAFKAVMYDNEAWSFTPAAEQTDPAGYEAKFAAAAHAHGYPFLAAPATDLVPVQPSYVAGADGGVYGTQYAEYLSMGFPTFSAGAPADVYEIQAQGAEPSVRVTNRFAAVVKEASNEARSAHAGVLVLAGLSTGPSGQVVTADDIVKAIVTTADVVDGYWLNIPQQGADCPKCTTARPDIAVDVLRQLEQMGY